MARWGKLDSLSSKNGDDRIELIEDRAEARAQFGENFGAFEFKLTRDHIEGLRGDNRAIVKVHGTIDEPSQMIFTRKEYIQARHKNHTFYTILDALSITHTFIFVGCGLYDPDVQLFLERYAQSYPTSRPHYIVMPKGLHKDIISSVKRNMNLHVLEYNPVDGHKELAESVADLVTLVDARRFELAGSQDW